jgi:hypothetical protein
MLKRILLLLLVLLIVIQFFHPSKNLSDTLITENDISKVYKIPADVHNILIQKCYDCHSNHTRYPWYNNVQPIAWWMADHVNEGKHELNFSEFKTYSSKKANHKMEELSDAINEGWMPLDTYLWLHRNARITEEDQRAINQWLHSLPIAIDKQ